MSVFSCNWSHFFFCLLLKFSGNRRAKGLNDVESFQTSKCVRGERLCSIFMDMIQGGQVWVEKLVMLGLKMGLPFLDTLYYCRIWSFIYFDVIQKTLKRIDQIRAETQIWMCCILKTDTATVALLFCYKTQREGETAQATIFTSSLSCQCNWLSNYKAFSK